MPSEIWCKIKAALVILLLAVAEARQVELDDASLPNPSSHEQGMRFVRLIEKRFSGASLQRPGGGPEAAEALNLVRNFREQEVECVPTWMDAMIADLNLQEKARLALEYLQAVDAHAAVQRPQKFILAQVDALRVDHTFHANRRLVTEHMQTMLADPNSQEQAKFLGDRIQAAMGYPNENEPGSVCKLADNLDAGSLDWADGDLAANLYGQALTASLCLHADLDNTMVTKSGRVRNGFAGARAHLPQSSRKIVCVEDQRCEEISPKCGGRATLILVAVCAVAVAIAYADRSVISVASLSMRRELGYSYKLQGTMLGAFFAGYVVTQVIAGAVADSKGGRDVLAVGVAVWALATLLTPTVARMGSSLRSLHRTRFAALLALRATLGAAEGLCFPSVQSLIATHVRRHQQSVAVAVATAASYFGIAVAFLWAPPLIYNYGWPLAFYFFGMLAVLWLPLVMLLPTKRPRHGAFVHQPVKIKLGLLRTPQAIAILVAQFTNSYGMYGLISWLPTWVTERGGASSPKMLGRFASVPYFMQAIIGVTAGLVADAALSNGASRRNVRVALQTVGMLLPGGCLLLGVCPGISPANALAFVTVGTSANALTLGGVTANALDIAPSNAGQLFAAGNTAAALAGLLAAPLTGSILDAAHGSEIGWFAAFGLCSVNYVVGAAVFAWLAGGARVQQDLNQTGSREKASFPKDNACTLR